MPVDLRAFLIPQWCQPLFLVLIKFSLHLFFFCPTDRSGRIVWGRMQPRMLRLIWAFLRHRKQILSNRPWSAFNTCRSCFAYTTVISGYCCWCYFSYCWLVSGGYNITVQFSCTPVFFCPSYCKLLRDQFAMFNAFLLCKCSIVNWAGYILVYAMDLVSIFYT